MATIIAIRGTGNSGKTTSIKLAAEKANQSGAEIIAKYYYRVNVDIVEVYVFITEERYKYVAYISKGDNAKEVKEAFEALEAFKYASINRNLVAEIKRVKSKYKTEQVATNINDIYKNIEDVINKHKNFQYDVIVVACHPDRGKPNSSEDAVEGYANQHSYIPYFIDKYPTKNLWNHLM